MRLVPCIIACLTASFGCNREPQGPREVAQTTAEPAQTTAGGEPQVQHRQWTVMIYMDADNNLEPYSVSDFRELSRVDYTGSVKVLVEYDRLGQPVGGVSTWSQTLRFAMRKGLRPEPEDAVDDLGEVNMGDPASLSAFVDWGKQQYPADNYMVIIWNHGQGWRAMVNAALKQLLAADTQLRLQQREIDASDSTVSHHLFSVSELIQSALPTTFRSVASDDTNHDTLFNREIVTALTGKNIDIIAFDACLMSMIETAYAFRDTVPYMVASEELEPGDGWKYDDFIGTLTAQTTKSPKDVARVAVDSFSRMANDDTTMAATDIKQVVPLAQAMSTLGDALSNVVKRRLRDVVAARIACTEYAASEVYADKEPMFPYVDIGELCNELSEKLKDEKSVVAACVQVKAALDHSIIRNYVGANRGEPWGSHGLSIYFPRDRRGYQEDAFEQGGYTKNNKFQVVDFVADEHWADFLQAYFKIH